MGMRVFRFPDIPWKAFTKQKNVERQKQRYLFFNETSSVVTVALCDTEDVSCVQSIKNRKNTIIKYFHKSTKDDNDTNYSR